MTQHHATGPGTGCGFEGFSDFISADAWMAVRILGALAPGPANLAQICRHAALPPHDAAALLDVLVHSGLAQITGRDAFALRFAANAISIAQIVQAVDGDVLRRAPQEQPPEIGEILRRMAFVTADILDNFSLAEAAEA